LLYDPQMLWQVGFQLSYLAVFGIVYLHPKFYGLFQVKNYWLDKAWSITCVSLTAQLATFPLGFYYFHQFPTYFLLSNLIVITGAYLILMGGLLLLFLEMLHGTLAAWFGMVLNELIIWFNRIVTFFSHLPYHQVDWVFISHWQLLVIYGILIALAYLLLRQRAVGLRYVYGLCMLFVLLSTWKVISVHQATQMVFYKIKGASVIDFISHGHVSTYYGPNAPLPETSKYKIDPFRLANYLPPFNTKEVGGLPIVQWDKIGKALIWESQKMIILTEDIKAYATEDKIEVDIIVLSNNQNIDIQKLLALFHFKMIIIDSTYDYYLARAISKRLDTQKISYWNIMRDGAYIHDLGRKSML